MGEAFKKTQQNSAVVDRLTQFGNLEERRNMTQEQKDAEDLKDALKLVTATKDVLKEERVKEDTALSNGIGKRLQDARLGVSTARIQELVAQLFKDAQDNATDPSGRVDREKLASEIERLTQKAIDDHKE